MRFYNRTRVRMAAMLMMSLTIIFTSSRLRADTETTGTCGGASITIPFTDVASSNVFFCSIAAAYFSGLTNGTSATTYSPNDFVTREQMAAFTTRTLDQSLRRGSRRAALGQFWTPQGLFDLRLTQVGNGPRGVVSDGENLWVANEFDGTISQVNATSGKVLGTWTGASLVDAIIVARGFVYALGPGSSDNLYRIDPNQPPGAVTVVTSNLGNNPRGITFDGSRIWTANSNDLNSGGSVSIVSFGFAMSVTTVTTGFAAPARILYDGSNMWVTDVGDDTLKKLDGAGNIIQTIAMPGNPDAMVFDGTNIWVSNTGASGTPIVVVRASTGMVLATLTGNGLNQSFSLAFDGERIMAANLNGGSLSLWKASDLRPLGSYPLGTAASRVCSDGLYFWITLRDLDALARF